MKPYSCGGMFSGAGGLDLGFEIAGYRHMFSTDWDSDCVATLSLNRPDWKVVECDARDFVPANEELDVLLAGFPCQGFSLGGNRNESDQRNQLFKEVVRVARLTRPRVVVIENVLNLRNMKDPATGKPFAHGIIEAISSAGYEVFTDFLRMSQFGVPQTRRRFLLVAFRGKAPQGYHLPAGEGEQSAEPFLSDLVAHGGSPPHDLSNHDPVWEFPSQVHVATREPIPPNSQIIPVRFSRTASDGNPVRDLSKPFPAVDTATIWGWAQGCVRAERIEVDRSAAAKFVRNPNATHKLWRIRASRLRAFTEREYARLQTFPDDWVFKGDTKRSIHMQVGNAVPVAFAATLAENVRIALEAIDAGNTFRDDRSEVQLTLNFR